jgi:uncharacterized protein (TIGR02599 family)
LNIAAQIPPRPLFRPTRRAVGFRRIPTRRGFTLVELMVSITVLVFLLLLIVSVTQTILHTWKSTTHQGQSFVAAQAALEVIKRQVAQATLNTYWTFLDAKGDPPAGNVDFSPQRYGRVSELFFLAGEARDLLGPDFGPGSALFFQIPGGYTEDATSSGLVNSLNVTGFFLKFGSDEGEMPDFVSARPERRLRWRFRLYEVREPTENFMTFADPVSDSFLLWASHPANSPAHARPLADNVILFLARCIFTDASGQTVHSYTYNSRTGGMPQPVTQHQLPPRVELTLVVLHESSALRIAAESGSTRPGLVAEDLFTDPSRYESDIAALSDSLSEKKLSFRIFRDEITLLAAHWDSSPATP